MRNVFHPLPRRFIIKDRDTFFSPAQRSQIVWEILIRVPYADEELGESCHFKQL